MTTFVPAETPHGINLGDVTLFQEEQAHEAFRLLRRDAPVHWNPGTERTNGFWSLTKYDDILFVSRNPLMFISSRGIAGPGLRNPDPSMFVRPGVGNASIITMDPPQHVKMRRLVNKGFTPRAVNAMEPRIREITRGILDEVGDRKHGDFVLEVASQLPLAVICGMMGLPRESWPLMFELTNSILGSGDPEYQAQNVDDPSLVGTAEGARETSARGMMRMFGYFQEVLAQRRAQPQEDDLVSILLEGEIDGEKLTEQDILAFCFLLVVAGNETTRNAISGGLVALDQHPAERKRLQDDMSLIDGAVEEILRWTSPLHHMSREATEDVEIRGQQIKAGQKVIMWYPSANRDEDVFPDPYRFDITRTPNEHLAFGIGEHFCLGAGFARKEIRVMFEELFARFPDIRVDGSPDRLRSNFINGIKHLPVVYQR
jgi:cytochrome P450